MFHPPSLLFPPCLNYLPHTLQQPIATSNICHSLTCIHLFNHIQSSFILTLILYLCHAALSSIPYLYMSYSSCSFQPIPGLHSIHTSLSQSLLYKPLPASLSSVTLPIPVSTSSTFYHPIVDSGHLAVNSMSDFCN